MKITSIQPTPNPNAFKFILDQKVLQQGVRHYGSVAEAKDDVLAVRLFGVAGVESLFFCENFVTVSMHDGADWRAMHAEVGQILEAHVPAAAPAAETAAFVDGILKGGDAELMTRINDVLDDRVRPALAGDGGGLEVLDLEGKTLRIRYQGACGTCPSSIAGTLAAIENMLQSEVDEELRVIAG